MPVYSLVARNCSDGSIKFLASHSSKNLVEFLDYLNANPSLIPDMYYDPPYRLYIVDDDFDEE